MLRLSLKAQLVGLSSRKQHTCSGTSLDVCSSFYTKYYYIKILVVVSTVRTFTNMFIGGFQNVGKRLAGDGRNAKLSRRIVKVLLFIAFIQEDSKVRIPY